MSQFRTIHDQGFDEIIINKSKFIGYASPIDSEDEAIEFINQIRKTHRDATHNVYAYVYGENSNIQRYSDDGEPSGTAGMPVLNVIKLENLKNIAVVVTRYFGGIKLGAGGLVRAYTKGAKIGIESGMIVDKTLFYDVLVEIDYTLLGKVENELSKNQYIIKNKEFMENVKLNILCIEEDIEKLKALMLNITSAKCKISTVNSQYYSIKDGKVLE
ncbi:YigZ family protein [Sedimentibacter sp. zth1]|uniref:YigZ family protein n=1 Tax=Sedimentibacter sp. zth1 TaxID=2816908 RepID=UPI001A9338E7|nr:YigZ family protein [Sedimentibacter sp. zth1]QSX06406.1 YigZ family protein [Sedimentibacter sp. zth1]